MSKKNRDKRHHKPQPEPDSKIYFSLPIVKILKDALCFFESFLVEKPDTLLPNIPFAKEVVEALKIKLDDMLQREEWNEETPLDYNEIHLLHSSCAMYLIELKYLQKYELIPPCIALCKQLALVVEHVDKEIAQQKRKHE